MGGTSIYTVTLARVLDRLGIDGLAKEMRVDPKTVRRWIQGNMPERQQAHLERVEREWQATDDNSFGEFSFIDLFAGIGGIRRGFEVNGGHCVFTSEWNKYAWETYKANFNTAHKFVGDINTVTGCPEDIDREIPDHDVLLAGFPCQPFSIAGVSKKNALGRAHGFACQDQGNLFFRIRDILAVKRPVAFLLENVKNLESHDKGNTFRVIMQTLEDELGYKVYPQVIDAKGFVPQHRERIYLVGFAEDAGFSWEFERPTPDTRKIGEILHPEDGSERRLPGEDYIGADGKVNPKYILTAKLWSYLEAYAEKHRQKGNGFGYGSVGPNDTSRTLSARYYKDGSEILVRRNGGRPRRLTPRECARLMGFDSHYFPGGFKIPVSDTQAYKQFGNSVVVPVIDKIASLMKPCVLDLKRRDSQPDPLAANG